MQTSKYLATMNYDVGAGFYSNFKSPLPYAFGLVPPETYQIWRSLLDIKQASDGGSWHSTANFYPFLNLADLKTSFRNN